MNNREINQLVAHHVMGWTYFDAPRGYRGNWWQPTENITDAWKVVEKMGCEYEIIISKHKDGMILANCLFMDDKGKVDFDKWYSATADIAPMAICLAALKAKGVEYD